MADEMAPRLPTRPDPDPTEATIVMLDGRINAVRDFFNSRLDAVERSASNFRDDLTRVPTTLDKALAAERQFNEAQMRRMVEHADANYAINSQKFLAADQARALLVASVNDRIEAVNGIVTANKVEADNYRELIAEQTRKNSTDVDAAVKAAFAASTLAVTQQNIANALASDKQGAAFTKDIEKLTVSLAQIQKSSDDKLEEVRKNNDQRVNDMKDRMGQMEARSGVTDPATARALQDMSLTITRLSAGSHENAGASKANSDNTVWIFAVINAIAVVALVAVDFLKK